MHNDSSIRFPGEAPAADASVVPVEGPAHAEPASLDDPVSQLESAAYGENYEFLPERLQAALRRIVQDFTSESELSRREEIRRIKKAHQFWRGLQYLWWSERDQNWHLPFEQTMLKVDPRLRYSELMRVMNSFMTAFVHAKKPPNISFDEWVPGEGE